MKPWEKGGNLVRIPNDPKDEGGGPFSDLFRLQAEFQTRLAEETMRYLHRLQGAAAPVAPGTVLLPDGSSELRVSGTPGFAVELRLEVENRQRVHCMVTPMLSPLVEASGVTWFPAAELSPASTLLAPQEVSGLVIGLPVPGALPAGTYRGALLLQGFREGAISVVVTVSRGGGGGARRVRAASKRAKPHRPKAGRREPTRRP